MLRTFVILRALLVIAGALIVIADLVIVTAPSLPNYARYTRAFAADRLNSTEATRHEVDVALAEGRRRVFMWEAASQICVVGVLALFYSGVRTLTNCIQERKTSNQAMQRTAR